MNLSFNALQGNLTELVSASHTNTKLCVNCDHTNLYAYGTFMGWISRVRQLSLYEHGVPPNLGGVVQKTHDAFMNHLQLTLDAAEGYFIDTQNFTSVSANEQTDRYIHLGNRISRWNEATTEFLKILKDVDNCWLNMFLKTYLPDEKKPFFITEIQYTLLQQVESAARFHQLTKSPVPIRALYQLSIGAHPEGNDKKHVQQWLHKLEKAQPPVDLDHAFHFLSTLALSFEQIPNSPGSLSDLIYGLITWRNHGEEYSNFFGHLFLNPSANHELFKNSLKPGDTIRCNDKVFTLSKELGKTSRNRVFLVEENANTIVTISQNQAMLHFRKASLGLIDRGFYPAQIYEVDREGRCAIMERLYDPFDGAVWTSNSAQLSKQDLSILIPLVKQIQWMVKEKFSPHTLLSKHLMFDQSGLLKHCKATGETPFNYHQYESFFHECAKGNEWVFAFLMTESGIYNRPERDFYHFLIWHTLTGEKFDIDHKAALKGIHDIHVINQGKKLIQEVLELQNRTFANDTQKLTQDQKNDINKKIFEACTCKKTAGILWPSAIILN